MGYHDPDNLRKYRVISLPIYGIVCQHDASNLQVKVRTYKPNDALNITDYSGTGWWIEVRFLRTLTDAEARDQPWQTYAEAEKARAARLEHARGARSDSARGSLTILGTAEARFYIHANAANRV